MAHKACLSLLFWQNAEGDCTLASTNILGDGVQEQESLNLGCAVPGCVRNFSFCPGPSQSSSSRLRLEETREACHFCVLRARLHEKR
jgi:hypothetical protein